jgi:hypothetical protein
MPPLYRVREAWRGERQVSNGDSSDKSATDTEIGPNSGVQFDVKGQWVLFLICHFAFCINSITHGCQQEGTAIRIHRCTQVVRAVSPRGLVPNQPLPLHRAAATFCTLEYLPTSGACVRASHQPCTHLEVDRVVVPGRGHAQHCHYQEDPLCVTL